MGAVIVTEAELRCCLPLDYGSLSATEKAFDWIEYDRVAMPPVMHIDVDPDSAVDIKGAFVEGLDYFAVKIATGFFSQPRHGIAELQPHHRLTERQNWPFRLCIP